MAFLEDLEKSGRDAINSVVSVGHNAQSAIDQASRNAASLAGSGVGSNGRIQGPIGDKFGHDPHEFVLNIARQMKGDCRELCKRIAERTQRLSYSFPTPQGTRKVTSKPGASASTNQIALTLVLAIADAPATAAEEAGRMASGLGVKERGLAGDNETYTIYPFGLPRGLFGIDDAVILTIVVPILAQIAAVVLPTLIAAAANVIGEVTKPKGPSPEEQAAAKAQAQEQEQSKTMITVAVVGVIVIIGGLGVYMAVRKKRAA